MLNALFEHNVLIEHGVGSNLLQRIDEHFFRSVLAGLIAGAAYIFLLRDRLRRFPYFTAWPIMVAIMLPVLLFTGAYIPSRTDALGGSFSERALSLHWLGEYLYWTLLMGGTLLMVRLNDQYGSGSIGHLSRRYHRPQQELRIFMFLDMRSSTAIAERLGPVRYFELLNAIYADITDD